MSYFRQAFHKLLELSEPPERMARAFSIGVFLSFSPFLGLHTVFGVMAILLFRLNKVATMAGVWSNVPWIVIPYYTFATWFGIQLLGMPEGIYLPKIGLLDLFKLEFWGWVVSQWRLLIPAFVGSLLLSLILAAVSYPTSLYLIRRFRKRRKHNEQDTSGLPATDS